ncbi:MAG TPA: hypothetical protein VFR09_03895 [Alphaproteobacteria bacterium]|nr:hypothetical protein [Alphaproteobacteria bacterium]
MSAKKFEFQTKLKPVYRFVFSRKKGRFDSRFLKAYPVLLHHPSLIRVLSNFVGGRAHA